MSAMTRVRFIALLGGMVTVVPSVASAQHQTMQVMAEANCDSLPAGPSRTDCYIGLSMISRQQGEIAAGAAQQIKSGARYRQVTGQQRKLKPSARKRK
jgi:hypothetical protein